MNVTTSPTRGIPSPPVFAGCGFGCGFGGFGFALTLIDTFADSPLPSVVVAVIVQEPGFFAFTVPLDTVAIDSLLDFQARVLLAASFGLIVAVILLPVGMLQHKHPPCIHNHRQQVAF